VNVAGDLVIASVVSSDEPSEPAQAVASAG
jgi:hypothetical protein